MTAYESMSTKLLQTGLYGIEQGGAVNRAALWTAS